MAELRGTRVYWRPSVGAATAPRQILKNAGYISIVLQAVQYKASGNLWQKAFGGSDKVTVSTQVTWQTSVDAKIATAIQDVRKVSVPSVNRLAIGRNIVLKVPAVADGIEMQFSIRAVRDDNLGKTLQILNSDDFKQPLQLAPVALGQALMVTSLVKKLFTDSDPADVLSASYPGIISEGDVSDPVANSRLVEGYIILVVKQDEEDALDFDVNAMSVTPSGLTVGGAPVKNTYVVYNVTFDKWKGRDQSTSWSKKYDQASTKADELMFAQAENHSAIITAAFDLLKEGGALLDEDVTYTKSEKAVLKKAAIQEVRDKIEANSPKPTVETIISRGPAIAGDGGVGAVPALEEEDFRPEVAAYAQELASVGLPFGFSVRP
jgi:hypothetical protein